MRGKARRSRANRPKGGWRFPAAPLSRGKTGRGLTRAADLRGLTRKGSVVRGDQTKLKKATGKSKVKFDPDSA